MYLGKYLIQTIRLFHNAYLPSTSDLSPRLSMLLEYPFRKLIILLRFLHYFAWHLNGFCIFAPN